jgi:hypothetical protein
VPGAAALHLTADGPWNALPLAAALVVTDPAGATGSLARLSVAGRLGGERLTGQVTTLDVEPAAGAPWRLAQAAGFTADRTALEVEPLRLQAGTQQASLGGRVDWAGPLRVTSEWAGVDVGPLCAALGGRDCEGMLGGTATLAGTRAAPKLELDATAPRLALGPADLGRVTATASLVGDVLTADIRAAVPDAGDVRLSGTASVHFDAASTERVGDVSVPSLTRARITIDPDARCTTNSFCSGARASNLAGLISGGRWITKSVSPDWSRWSTTWPSRRTPVPRYRSSSTSRFGTTSE